MKKDIIHILVKPTHSCNLRCIYCFHAGHYENNILSKDAFRKILILAAEEYNTIDIIWHGGEPLCAGIDTIQTYFNIEKEIISSHNIKIFNSIQTNLTLIDNEWIALFKEHGIKSIGTSFDGVANNDTRRNTQKWLEKRQLCMENGVNVGAICVISAKNIDTLEESYNLFKHIGCGVNFNHYIGKSDDPLFVSPEIYANKIISLFDIWCSDSSCNIRVNPFENYLSALCFGERKLCANTSCLSSWLCMEPGGELFPCDKSFGEDNEYCYGNIITLAHLSDIYNSQAYNKIIEQATERREKCLSECEWWGICHGGCNHNAFVSRDIKKHNHPYCEIEKKIYAHILMRINEFRENMPNSINPYLKRFLK